MRGELWHKIFTLNRMVLVSLLFGFAVCRPHLHYPSQAVFTHGSESYVKFELVKTNIFPFDKFCHYILVVPLKVNPIAAVLSKTCILRNVLLRRVINLQMVSGPWQFNWWHACWNSLCPVAWKSFPGRCFRELVEKEHRHSLKTPSKYFPVLSQTNKQNLTFFLQFILLKRVSSNSLFCRKVAKIP